MRPGNCLVCSIHGENPHWVLYIQIFTCIEFTKENTRKMDWAKYHHLVSCRGTLLNILLCIKLYSKIVAKVFHH